MPRLKPGGNGHHQRGLGVLLLQFLAKIRLQSSHLDLGSKVWTAQDMLVVLQDALAQGTLAVVLPFSHLEHLSHSTEPCGELPKESPLALWQIGSGFLLAHPVNAVNELCWDGMLLLPVLFQLHPTISL